MANGREERGNDKEESPGGKEVKRMEIEASKYFI